MTARLTAWILAFCIGLPMCWCCDDSAVAAAPAAETSCCAMHQTEEGCGHSSSPAGQSKHCPCLEHEDSRDTHDIVVAVPAPQLKLLAAPLWEAPLFQMPLPFIPAQAGARHDHGPPAFAPPLYARHCALLL